MTSTRIVLLLFGLSVSNYLTRTVMAIAAPTLIDDFGLSEVQMGTVYSAFILSYAVLMGPGGWLADRIGPRKVLLTMGVGTAIFTALVPGALSGRSESVAGALAVLVVLRFALGIFSAPLYPASARMVANWVAREGRAQAQGVIIAGAPLGGAIAPVLFAPLIAESGWQAAFLTAGAVAALMTGVWTWLARDRPLQNVRSSTGDADQPAERPSARVHSPGPVVHRFRIWMLSFGYFTVNYFEYIFFYWIYYYFQTVRGLGTAESAIYTTMLYIVMALMMPLGGWLSDRLVHRLGAASSRRIVAAAGMAISGPLLFVATIVASESVMVVMLALALGCVAASEGPFWAAASEEAGTNHSGTAGGLMNSVGNVGGLLAPVLTPAIAARAGWSTSLYFASTLIVVGAGTWFLAPRQRLHEDLHGVP